MTFRCKLRNIHVFLSTCDTCVVASAMWMSSQTISLSSRLVHQSLREPGFAVLCMNYSLCDFKNIPLSWDFVLMDAVWGGGCFCFDDFFLLLLYLWLSDLFTLWWFDAAQLPNFTSQSAHAPLSTLFISCHSAVNWWCGSQWGIYGILL